jgi:hypothetical protein
MSLEPARLSCQCTSLKPVPRRSDAAENLLLRVETPVPPTLHVVVDDIQKAMCLVRTLSAAVDCAVPVQKPALVVMSVYKRSRVTAAALCSTSAAR